MFNLELTVDANVDVFETPLDIEGVLYFLELRYSSRDDRWYIWLYDVERRPIVTGIKAVTRVPLFSVYSDPRLPPGDMKITRIDNPDDPITRETFNGSAFFTYLSARELQIMEGLSVLSRVPGPEATVQ